MHEQGDKNTATDGEKPPGILSRPGRPVYLMVSLFVLLLLYPISEQARLGRLAINIAYSLMLISAAWAIHTNRVAFFAACVLAVPWLVLEWLKRLMGIPGWPICLEIVKTASLGAFILLLLGMMINSVLREKYVTGNTLCRAVSAYLLTGVAWSIMFGLVLKFDGDAFVSPVHLDLSGGELMYLSFCTLTTLGYGDITPVSPMAQGLVMIEATIGPLYLAILVARLVAIYSRERSLH